MSKVVQGEGDGTSPLKQRLKVIEGLLKENKWESGGFS